MMGGYLGEARCRWFKGRSHGTKCCSWRLKAAGETFSHRSQGDCRELLWPCWAGGTVSSQEEAARLWRCSLWPCRLTPALSITPSQVSGWPDPGLLRQEKENGPPRLRLCYRVWEPAGFSFPCILLDSGLAFYKNAQVLSIAQVLGEKRYHSECFLCAGTRASTLTFSSGKEP